MNAQLTPVEIQELQQLLQNDTPAQQALTTLQQYNGNLKANTVQISPKPSCRDAIYRVFKNQLSTPLVLN